MKVVNVQIIVPAGIDIGENDIVEQFIGEVLSTCKPLEDFFIGEIQEEQNECVINKAKGLCND